MAIPRPMVILPSPSMPPMVRSKDPPKPSPTARHCRRRLPSLQAALWRMRLTNPTELVRAPLVPSQSRARSRQRWIFRASASRLSRTQCVQREPSQYRSGWRPLGSRSHCSGVPDGGGASTPRNYVATAEAADIRGLNKFRTVRHARVVITAGARLDTAFDVPGRACASPPRGWCHCRIATGRRLDRFGSLDQVDDPENDREERD